MTIYSDHENTYKYVHIYSTIINIHATSHVIALLYEAHSITKTCSKGKEIVLFICLKYFIF